MSSTPDVDFSQIRGDWTFHMNYLTNAISQTVSRQQRMLGDAGPVSDELKALVAKQGELWAALTGAADAKGVIPLDADSPLQVFIETSRATKGPCDAFEEANGLGGSTNFTDAPGEHFTEACRQIRALCDDLEMMREQRPADQ